MTMASPSPRKPGARKPASVTPAESYINDNTFDSCTDYATLNASIHQQSRSDTFRTPSRLGADSPGGRYSSPIDGIYKRRDNKEGNRITKQIHEEVQDLQEATIGMRKQLTESWERETGMAEMLAQVGEKVQFLHSQALKKANDAKVDLSPLIEEIRSGEKRSTEVIQQLTQQVESRLLQNLGQVREEVQGITRRQQVAEDVHFAQVLEEIRKAEVQVQKSLSQTSMEILKTATEDRQLKTIDQETSLSCSFLEKLESKRIQINNEQHDKILDKLSRAGQTASSESKTVLVELGKIQQALHVDFAQIVDELKDLRELDELEEDGDDALVDLYSPTAPEVKRFRHFWSQTDALECKDGQCMTDESLLVNAGYKKIDHKPKRQSVVEMIKETKQVQPKAKPVFADAEEMKKKMRAQLLANKRTVTDYYHGSGCFRAIATSPLFESLTMFVIFVNAIWIAVDTDMNHAAFLYDADPVFIAAENAFCTFFSFELFVRFMSFRKKRYCLKDKWFIFDGILVGLMIIETWVMAGVVVLMEDDSGDSAGAGNASMLRMARMVRMLRISRMARLLRKIPELLVLVKGIKAASRSVMIFFLMWLVMIYVFAVPFKQLTEDSNIGNRYFETVPEAMSTLLLECILPSHGDFVHDLLVAEWWLFPIIMLFILLAAITVMYMLVGVLVDVVTVIATAEKEGMVVTQLATELKNLLLSLGRSQEQPITQFEFKTLLQNDVFCGILQSVNIDVVMLCDTVDVIYKDPEAHATGISFAQLVELLMSSRGSNMATLQDVKESAKFITKSLATQFDQLTAKLQCELGVIKTGMAVGEDDGSFEAPSFDYEADASHTFRFSTKQRKMSKFRRSRVSARVSAITSHIKPA